MAEVGTGDLLRTIFGGNLMHLNDLSLVPLP